MLNLAHLQFFRDAVRLGSVTEAAKANHVSQSALSQGIRNLERDLSVELTTHQKNRFVLTDAGWLVFEHAQRLFEGVGKMQEDLNVLSGKVAGKITFACTNSIARALIPKALTTCRRRYPALNVKFHRGSVRYIVEQINKGNVDFAIIVDGDLFRGYEKLPIRQGVFSIFSHPASEGLAKEGTYVDHIDSPEVKKILEQCPGFNVLEELSSWGMVEEFVKQGLGQGFLPDFMVDEKGMKKIDSDIPTIPYEIVAVRRNGMTFSHSMRSFINTL